MSQKLTELCTTLSAAQAEHDLAMAMEAEARKVASAALNRLNDCQRAVDAAIGEMRSSAALDSDWGSRARVRAGKEAS